MESSQRILSITELGMYVIIDWHTLSDGDPNQHIGEAATHKQALRDELEQALSRGLPVFISECSLCEASGNGHVDYESADAWLELIDRYQMSHVAWSLCNKAESASLLRSDCAKLSDWTQDVLSPTGKCFFAAFRR